MARRGRPPRERGSDETAGGEFADEIGDAECVGGVDAGSIVDPAALAGGFPEGTDAASVRKQRKPRGPNKSKKGSDRPQVAVDTLKNTLVFAHIGLAGLLQAPEMALTADQANVYASAVADVMSHYDTAMPAKTLSWINLVTAAGGIYIQKFQTISARKKTLPAGQEATRTDYSRIGI